MQKSLNLQYPTPTPLPTDLTLLLKDVPDAQIAGLTESDLRGIVQNTLVVGALRKFGGRITRIETLILDQPELF